MTSKIYQYLIYFDLFNFICIILIMGHSVISTQKQTDNIAKSIKIEDGVLSYRILGQGEPILIINGGPGMNSDGFYFLANEF